MARSLFRRPRGTGFAGRIETFEEDAEPVYRRQAPSQSRFRWSYRNIWNSDLALVHKLNLTALRSLLGILLLCLAGGLGLLVALTIQFLAISSH